MFASGRSVLRNTYGIEILPFVLGQQIYILFLQLMNLFAGHLGGRKELVIPIWVGAERNTLLEDRQMFLLGFYAVLNYLPSISAACYSLQNFFKIRGNCFAGRGRLAAKQFHQSRWLASANQVLDALCSSYKEDTWEQSTCFSGRLWWWLLHISRTV